MVNDPSTSQSSSEKVSQARKTRRKNGTSEEEIARKAAIAKLAAQGLAGGQIAEELGVTRNVVIGICYRNGIKLRGKKKKKTPPAKKALYLSKKREVAPKTVRKRKPKPIIVAPSGPKALYTGARGEELVGYEAHQGVSLQQLGSKSCHWPLGELNDPPTRFCGREAEDKYCPVHLHVKKYGSSNGIPSCVSTGK